MGKSLKLVAAAGLMVGGLAMEAQATPIGIAAVRADGEGAYVHDPNSGELFSTISRVTTGRYWAGVAGYNVDPSTPIDELFFTRDLMMEETGGGGGVEVMYNETGNNRAGYTIGVAGGSQYRAITTGMVLDGGTREGLAILRENPSSGGNAVFEFFDPEPTLTGDGRYEWHLGTTHQLSKNVIETYELSGDHPGDEVIVIRDNLRTVEVYGRSGSGDNSYTQLHSSFMAADVENLTIAEGILPGGEDGFVFLRTDGRLSFWNLDFVEDNETDNNRRAFTNPNDHYRNFIRVANVLEEREEQEIIVGYHNEDEGVSGYRLLALPDEGDYDFGFNNIGDLEVLATYDLGTEIRNIDLVTIPEPGTLALLACGGLLMAGRRRRRA